MKRSNRYRIQKITWLLTASFLISFCSFAKPKKAEIPQNTPPAESTHAVNFRVHPLRFVDSVISLQLDVKIGSQFTLGPSLVYWHRANPSPSDLTRTDDVLGFGAGARLNWFSSGVYKDGVYLGTSFDYGSQKKTVGALAQTKSSTTTSLSSSWLAGYGWFWESFNLMAAGGFTIPIKSSPYTLQDSSGYIVRKGPLWTTSQWTLEMTAGWTI